MKSLLANFVSLFFFAFIICCGCGKADKMSKPNDDSSENVNKQTQETAVSPIKLPSSGLNDDPNLVGNGNKTEAPLSPQSSNWPQAMKFSAQPSTPPQIKRAEIAKPKFNAPSIKPRMLAEEVPRETAAIAESADIQVAPQDLPVRSFSELQSSEEAAGYHTVEVFYGTDRKPFDKQSLTSHFKTYSNSIITFCFTLIIGGVLMWVKQPKGAMIFGIVGLVVTGFFLKDGIRQADKIARAATSGSTMYSSDRGELSLGTCAVSIPYSHQVGELESPALLKFELTEKPEKHVVLLEVLSQQEEEFFENLNDQLSRSETKSLLIFVHGYNVSFEDAARRTAQIAYDLQFEGIPLFYSWPSQAELVSYTVDRQNSLWTVGNLRDFLLKLSQHSDAESVNLIAHSMGNRAMGNALKEIATEFQDNAQLFNQVILAAPDVDAEVFKNEIAPQIVRTAKRVTLYASQNDLALIASKQVNGFPRAGDTGPGILILPGIETIDVSAIDTSLLGHSYYGDNNSIISDIYSLIRFGQPASQRRWLKPVVSSTGGYWIFDRQGSNISTRLLPETSR